MLSLGLRVFLRTFVNICPSLSTPLREGATLSSRQLCRPTQRIIQKIQYQDRPTYCLLLFYGLYPAYDPCAYVCLRRQTNKVILFFLDLDTHSNTQVQIPLKSIIAKISSDFSGDGPESEMTCCYTKTLG